MFARAKTTLGSRRTSDPILLLPSSDTYPIKDCFVVKAKIQELTNNQAITLAPEFVKEPAKSVAVAEGSLEGEPLRPQ